MAEAAFRISVVGTQEDLARLHASAAAASHAFEIEPADPLRVDQIAARAPDVAVIGTGVEKPLPLARDIRLVSPKSQIVFLVSAAGLERFRAALPFVPNLASAWTSSVAADAASLARVVSDAARTARRRAANSFVFGRINQQLSARKTAPEEVRRSQLALTERYLATILTQSPDAFVALEPTGQVVAFNDAAAGLFGDVLTQGAAVVHLVPDAERKTLQDLLARAARGGSAMRAELSLGEDEQAQRHVEISVAPVHDETGLVASVSITARDITERKAAEERQRLLIGELNHRVKNTLAIVQALAQQSFKGSRAPDEERAAFTSRLSALAAAHDLLTSHAWHSASLRDLADSSVKACGADQGRVEFSGPAVTLAPQSAVSVAMAFHELCTNAIKYGALSTAAGRIEVHWSVEREGGLPRLHLEWIESGGPPVSAPARRGFGLRMLERGLATDLKGSVDVDFAREGLVCRIDAPLPVAAREGGTPSVS